jgi:hypothetical protein
LDAEGGKFLEDFPGHKVISRGFLRREVFDYCLHLKSFEALNRGIRVGKGFQEMM